MMRSNLGTEFKTKLTANMSEIFMDRLSTSFKLQLPETRLIQYDCGKLQVMSKLLRTLKSEGHRALIFTQMTKVLDILEAFLSFHGLTYLRLDGSTKVEQRQLLMERFNNDTKYFCFILSTRSGGVGINLTGADTVIFYDSDWNPTMDAQAQDRCHRIGQTRDVHIYRLVSDRTVEENILRKANQKKLLGDLAIEGGNFTTAFFKQQTIHDLFNVDDRSDAAVGGLNPGPKEIHELDSSPLVEGVSKKAIGAFETAIATVEEAQDITVIYLSRNIVLVL
jgi:SNF2 family DNA or RNA helicase